MYIMGWEWDDAKNAANTEKHGVSFEKALQVFIDPGGIEKEDLAHLKSKERRLWQIGRLKSGRVVTVVYTLQGNKFRLISAQERRRERREYAQAKSEKKTSSTFSSSFQTHVYTEQDIALCKAKVNIHIRLDAGIVSYLKEKAKQEGGRYQSLINRHLRESVLKECDLESRLQRVEEQLGIN